MPVVGQGIEPSSFGVNRLGGKLQWNNEEEGDTLDVVFAAPEVDTFKMITGQQNGGINNFTTEDGVNGRIYVQLQGWYKFEGGYSMSATATNVVSHVAVFRNDEVDPLYSGQIERTVSTPNDVGSLSSPDMYFLEAGDNVNVMIKASKTGTMEFEHFTFIVN